MEEENSGNGSMGFSLPSHPDSQHPRAAEGTLETCSKQSQQSRLLRAWSSRVLGMSKDGGSAA